MDEEDMYGIPGDYYLSQGTLRDYPEDPPAAFLDEFLDKDLTDNPFYGFGEYMRATVVGFVSN
jgi:hypothetical protein